MRTKLTPEQKENQRLLDEEKRIAASIISNIEKIEKNIKLGILPLNPTRKFSIDEKVQFGAHKETYVREIYKNGLYYKVECISVKRDRDKPAKNEFHIVEWYELYSLEIGNNFDSNLTKIEEYRIRQSNTSLESLLHLVYHPGVDFDIEYQREHVWSLDDKIALIDSIFNNIDIGKFVFVQRDFSVEDKLYEIIDGKQRLTALCEFYEDRFKYKGYLYSELSGRDKRTFDNHGVVIGYLENPSKKAILESFIKLNTCGKPMDHKHIDKVKELLKTIK